MGRITHKSRGRGMRPGLAFAMLARGRRNEMGIDGTGNCALLEPCEWIDDNDDVEGLAATTVSARHPELLIDLESFTLVAASPGAKAILGVEGNIAGTDGLQFSVDRTRARDALVALRVGTVDTYTARTQLRRTGDTTTTVTIAVRAVGDELPRRYAIASYETVGHQRNGTQPGSDDRVTALEGHLLRIARELEAAGVMSNATPMLDIERFPTLADLSAKQREITQRLLRGQRVPTIAREMYLSSSTVRNHLSTIFHKLGVHSQAELLAKLASGPDEPPTR
jgi:DNA-binding CsgD family transcriptional regulator